jgi:hypothetical protein
MVTMCRPTAVKLVSRGWDLPTIATVSVQADSHLTSHRGWDPPTVATVSVQADSLLTSQQGLGPFNRGIVFGHQSVGPDPSARGECIYSG